MPTLALGLHIAILDLDAGPFAILFNVLDLVSEQYLRLTCRLHVFEQQPLSSILGQNQDAVGCSDFLKNAQVDLQSWTRPMSNPYSYFFEKFPFRDKTVVNIPATEYLQSSRSDSQRPRMRIYL